MLTCQIPHAPRLFFAADTTNIRGTTINGTGLADSAEEARARCVAEISEGIACLGAKYTLNFPILGSAAGVDKTQVHRRARHEAIERRFARAWWRGEWPAKTPAKGTKIAFDNMAAHWRHPDAPTVHLISISPCHGPDVCVAWSCDAEQRSLCFGMAARADGPSAATAALKEVTQMEFGLGIIRYRQQSGIQLTRLERIKLARARRLTVQNCTTLFSSAQNQYSEQYMEMLSEPIQTTLLPSPDGEHLVSVAYRADGLNETAQLPEQDHLRTQCGRWDLY